MPTDTGSRLLDAAQAYRDALEDQNQAAVDRMARGWVTALERVELEVQQLMAKMEAARLAGVEPSPAWLYQQRRLASVTDQAMVELRRWLPLAEQTVRENSYAAAAKAQDDAQALAREAARAHLPGVEATFTDINPTQMATVLGHLAPGGPLRDLLYRIAGETIQAAEDAILQGVVLGKGSDWITRQLRTALDIPRWRAETLARTEALRVYRETTRESFRGSNVVGSWVWTSALDRRTCPACMALHGSEFSLEETLDGHPRCRCAMVPLTKSWAELGIPGMRDTRPTIETGPDWFARQPDAIQASVLGPLKYGLWKTGDIDLEDMVARVHSPEWGTMRRERSVREMETGRNANYRDEDRAA